MSVFQDILLYILFLLCVKQSTSATPEREQCSVFTSKLCTWIALYVHRFMNFILSANTAEQGPVAGHCGGGQKVAVSVTQHDFGNAAAAKPKPACDIHRCVIVRHQCIDVRQLGQFESIELQSS